MQEKSAIMYSYDLDADRRWGGEMGR